MSIKINPVKNTTTYVFKKAAKNPGFIIPVTLTPIVAYMKSPNSRTRDRNELIEKEQEHIAHPVTDRTEFNTEQLKRAGVKDSDIEHYLKTDGHVTDEGKKILRENHKTFKGTHPEETEFQSPETNFAEYSDIAENDEIAELDNTIEAINNVLENPFLLGAAAELIPFAKFIQPGVDFANGNTEKAIVGTVTRGVDILLSPLKLLLAGSKGICDGVVGLMTDDKEYGFIKGFTGFYKDWAEGRDNLENEFLGLPSKEEQLKQLEEIKKQKIAERERKIKELQGKRTGMSGMTLEEKQQKMLELILTYDAICPKGDSSEYDNYREWDIQTLDKKIEKLGNVVSRLEQDAAYNKKQQAIKEAKQQKMLELILTYDAICPKGDSSEYDNYREWDIQTLDKKIQKLGNIVSKLEQEARYNEKQQQIKEEKQQKMLELILTFDAINPNGDLSEYYDYKKWDIQTLDKKIEKLKNIIAKLEQISNR